MEMMAPMIMEMLVARRDPMIRMIRKKRSPRVTMKRETTKSQLRVQPPKKRRVQCQP